MTSNCLNCAYPLEDSFHYCPSCSQKTHLHRLSLHDVLHDVIHYFTHADKGLFGLIRDLFRKNGRVAAEYVSGRRKTYFPPLNFYLLAATLFVLVMHTVSPHKSFDVLKEHPELNYIPDKKQKEHVIQIYERQHKAVSFMNKYSNTVAMIAVPLLCFIYWLFYLRGRYNYTEHLIAGLYMIGFANLLYVLFFVPVSILLGIKQGSRTALFIVGAFMIFQIVYNTVFYYRFMDNETKGSLWKAAGVSLFVVVFWFALSSFLVGLYIANGFWGLV